MRDHRAAQMEAGLGLATQIKSMSFLEQGPFL